MLEEVIEYFGDIFTDVAVTVVMIVVVVVVVVIIIVVVVSGVNGRLCDR